MKIIKAFITFFLFFFFTLCSKKPPPYEFDGEYYGDISFPEIKDFSLEDKKIIDDNWVEEEKIIPDILKDTKKDETPPKVLSAFSVDGKSVSVRFDEAIDHESGGEKENFSIWGSDMSNLPVINASVNGVFTKLTLSPDAKINPQLTYEVIVKNVKDVAGNKIDPKYNKAKINRSVYLAIIWHQHQPFYLDPSKDELQGPWVRKHATKDYYDMAAMLKNYPDVHITINLTPVLLVQLLTYYVERLSPYVDLNKNKVDEEGFFSKWKGKTDPWIDLLLMDTPDPFSNDPKKKPTEKQIGLFYDDPWSCLSTAEATMNFFPEYQELRDKNPLSYTHDDLLKLKIFFELAWIDPDFLKGAVILPDGDKVDLSDVVKMDSAGKFYLKNPPDEDLANRLVAEEFKIMKNVIAIHKALMFNPQTKKGQIEITTTPFYHPILPLLINSDNAKIPQPFDILPSPPFKYPGDAMVHVVKAVEYYKSLFGIPPSGMWPGEGSVSEDVVALFVGAKIKWIATDMQVLKNSYKGEPPPCFQCEGWKIDVDNTEGDGGTIDDEMMIVFRDTGLSNKVGFTFQPFLGEVSAFEFLKDVVAMAPSFGGKDRIVVVVMDGENPWELYTKEHDGKGFLHSLYKKIEEAYIIGEIIPVTPVEYIEGNPERNVPAHPIHEMKEIEPLFPGSWIDGTFSIWIGENEENQGWEYLTKARKDLEKAGIPKPNPSAQPPQDKNTKAYAAYLAYEEIYAAEGSDWFWWYGQDMTSPANDDTPFDRAFRTHLTSMYEAANKYLKMSGGKEIEIPDFAPIVQAKPQAPLGPFTEGKEPKIDGLFLPNESEWTVEGGFFFDNDSGGAISSPNDDIAVVYYGYTEEDFYLALSMNEDMSKKLKSNYSISIYFPGKHIINKETGEYVEEKKNKNNRFGEDLKFLTGGASFEVFLNFQGDSLKVILNKADGNEGWIETTHNIIAGGPLKGGKLIEIKLPFKNFKIQYGDPLEISIFAAEGNKVIDSAPYTGSKVIFEDISNLVYVTFECDVSGNKIDISTYVQIKNPPQPKGKGIVHIAGNHDKLQNWIPNKVPLRDDGISPDKVKGDNIWTITFGFTPGTLLRYKYTIGLPLDEGKWAGTEEFPLTERGYEVPKDPKIKKVTIKDIFADRPNPTGTLAPNTLIIEE